MLICVCGFCIDENEERTERKVTVLKAERKDQERMVNWWRPRWECSQCRCGERRAGRWVAFLRVDNEDEWDTMRHCHLAYCHHSDKATNLVTGVPTGSPSITVSCSLSVKSGISSLTSSSTMKMVASLASCWAPLFWEKLQSEGSTKMGCHGIVTSEENLLQNLPQHVLWDCIPWSSQNRAADWLSHQRTSTRCPAVVGGRTCRTCSSGLSSLESVGRIWLGCPLYQSWVGGIGYELALDASRDSIW